MSRATNIQQKLCLVTVSNKEYWSGTLVAILSFLKHNKWFDGDIKIITADERLRLKKLNIPGANLMWSDSKLNEKLKDLCEVLPELSERKERLLILNVFRLSSYQRVIYIDSDLLFLQNIKDYIMQAEFMAAPDPWLVRGYYRSRKSFLKNKVTEGIRDECYTSFFNSGLLSIGSSYLNETTYTGLLKHLTSDFFQQVQDDIADEPLLNFYFEEHVHMLPVELNSSVHVLVEQGKKKQEPIVLHFTGRNKPWRLRSWLSLMKRSRSYLPYLLIWIGSRYVQPFVIQKKHSANHLV